MTEKLIINFAPTGMVPQKKDNPHIPISVNEIVENVHQAYEKGITTVHVHARHPDSGQPDYHKKNYEKILSGLHKFCPGLIVCISLSGRNFPQFEKRAEPLSLCPDMASLTLSSLNFKNQASINSPDMIMALLEEMHKYGVKPEFEVFDLGMLNFLNYMINKGWVKPPYYINFIFGNIFSMQPTFATIAALLQELPENSHYAFGGIGKYQLDTHLMAIAHGAGVRIGLEDNLHLDRNRQILARNIDLIDRIHRLASIAEREIMCSEDFGALGFANTHKN